MSGITEFSYIQMRPDCKAPDPTRNSMDKTSGFASHDNPSPGRPSKQVRHIFRDGDVVVIECVTTNKRIEVPWASVAFSRPMPKREQRPDEKAQQQKGK